uniref:Uncharacterized protein n=1 Tax=Medicago truncatula TaxID=3880 RepID=A2Q581_MEDTR|nr:hypothetical protein MtrDRAFT_AC160516g14v2 [Medicago truncatula]
MIINILWKRLGSKINACLFLPSAKSENYNDFNHEVLGNTFKKANYGDLHQWHSEISKCGRFPFGVPT